MKETTKKGVSQIEKENPLSQENVKSFKSKNILLISYYFPPIKSVAVLRVYYLHKELKKYFGSVHVVTTSNRNRLQSEPLKINVDSLYEIPTIDYRTLTNLGKKRQNSFAEENKKKWFNSFSKFVNSFPFNLLIGEGGLIYIIFGLFKAVKLIRQNQISHVFSSFRPYSDHVIANLLKRFFPNIIWIADFRDLHVDPIYQHVYGKRFQHWCNKKIIKSADIVTTVSNGLSVQLKKYHPNVEVFRNGIGDLMNYEAYSTITPHSKFTITYTGSMFQNERDPSILFASIKSLLEKGQIAAEKIQLIYAGKDGITWNKFVQRFALEHLSINRGLLPLKEAHQLQKNTHINLLLSSSHPTMTGNLTGKLYEYLAAKNPIILLLNGSKDTEFETLFQDLDAGLVAYNDPEQISYLENFLLIYYNEWLTTGRLTKNITDEKLQPYRWDHIGKEFVEKLAKLN